MTVRIYQPAKTAMQSGKAKTRRWVLEHAPETARRPEPLMGWISAGDTKNQVRLGFDTKEEAIAYAKKHNLAYVVQEPRRSKPRIKTYADNFAFGRTGSWTH
jgi:hypothetical protein